MLEDAAPPLVCLHTSTTHKSLSQEPFKTLPHSSADKPMSHISTLGRLPLGKKTVDSHHKDGSVQIDLHTQATGPAVDLVTN